MARRKSSRKTKRAASRCDCRRKTMRGTPCCVAKRRKATGSRRQSQRTIILPPVDPGAPPAMDPFSMPDVVLGPAVIAQMKAQGRWTAEREAHQRKVDAWMRGEDVRFDGRRR